MNIRDEYLRMWHGDVAEAAAYLAVHLNRSVMVKGKERFGLTRPDAILRAVEIFPEIKPGWIVKLNHRSGWDIDDLPPVCPNCGQALLDGDVCRDCCPHTSWIAPGVCEDCGIPAPEATS